VANNALEILEKYRTEEYIAHLRNSYILKNEKQAVEIFFQYAHLNRKCGNCEKRKLKLNLKTAKVICKNCGEKTHLYKYTIYEGMRIPAHRLLYFIDLTHYNRKPHGNKAELARKTGLSKKTIQKLCDLTEKGFETFRDGFDYSFENTKFAMLDETKRCVATLGSSKLMEFLLVPEK